MLGQRHAVRGDAGASGGKLANHGDVEVAKGRHRHGARDGRGREHQCVRDVLRLSVQQVPLLHTEAMLLVDHHEAKVEKLHVVLQQGVGADDDARLTGGRAQERRALLCHRQLSGDERGGEKRAQLGAEHLLHGAQVLSGQHLGGREENGLTAGVGDLQHGAQGHERFTRTHLTLHEPTHGNVRRNVGSNFGAYLCLIAGQRKG